MDSYESPRYPAIRFLIRFGGWLAPGVAILPLVATIAAVASGLPWWLLAAGVVAAPILFLLMASYVEMARIIADTLMPR